MDELPSRKSVIMSDGTLFKGKIETRLSTVTPSLPVKVQESYEHELLMNGIQKSLDVWDMGTTPERLVLLTGFFEYEVSLKHDLPFTINLHWFSTEDDAKRFMIHDTIYRPHLTRFQLMEMMLLNKALLTSSGRENMRLGGKGVKIFAKVDTKAQLGNSIDVSLDTMR